jgi:DNA-binding response OmpR family regulator
MDRVLIVDDDLELCALLEERLRTENFIIDAVHDGPSGADRALSQDYSLVVLDLMLPGMNGLDVLRSIRARSFLPVLILTARGEDVDRILGLEIGADDYLPKPFNPRELIARIRAILRRTARGTLAHEPLVFEDIRLDRAARQVKINGTPLSMTNAEFAVLEYLLQNAGQVVTREQLTEAVLGRRLGPFDRVIDVHVSNIRKKLAAREGANRIKAIRGSGYILVPAAETK